MRTFSERRSRAAEKHAKKKERADNKGQYEVKSIGWPTPGTNFEWQLNDRGLEISPKLLAFADEVIERQWPMTANGTQRRIARR
jgi:hypothetical protein